MTYASRRLLSEIQGAVADKYGAYQKTKITSIMQVKQLLASDGKYYFDQPDITTTAFRRLMSSLSTGNCFILVASNIPRLTSHISPHINHYVFLRTSPAILKTFGINSPPQNDTKWKYADVQEKKVKWFLPASS